MGYALDWVSVKGLEGEDVLARLGLADTGEPMDWPEQGGFMWAATPHGRIVVVANRLGWLGEGRLSGMSLGAEAVACSAEDNECWVGAWGYADGAQVWSVIHDQAGHDGDLTHMETEGEVPEIFAAIHARLLGDLKADLGQPADHLFDAPQDLAAILGGWRPESLAYDDLEFFEAEIVSEIADDWRLSYDRRRKASGRSADSWDMPRMSLDVGLALFGLVPALAGGLGGLFLLAIPVFHPEVGHLAMFWVGGVVVMFLSLAAGAGIWSLQGFSSLLLACAPAAMFVIPTLADPQPSLVMRTLAWMVVASALLGVVGTARLRLARWKSERSS